MLTFSMGNVRETSLKEIWSTSVFRQEVLALKWGDSKKCMTCEFIRFCERCPGEAYLEHGDLARPSAGDCVVARACADIWSQKEPT
jgi:radical SAM protein with 4Fe4S-binding SPASM domain